MGRLILNLMRGAGSIFEMVPPIDSNRFEELRKEIIYKTSEDAMTGDWQKIGDDMRKSMSHFAKEYRLSEQAEA